MNLKSHDLGWELSPIDLVMSNSILEPVFSAEQREVLLCISSTLSFIKHLLQRQSRMLRPVYLTETPYLKSHDAEFDSQFGELRSGNSLDLDSISLEPDQLTDKPTLPVLDTRRANFLLGRVVMAIGYCPELEFQHVINFDLIMGFTFPNPQTSDI